MTSRPSTRESGAWLISVVAIGILAALGVALGSSQADRASDTAIGQEAPEISRPVGEPNAPTPAEFELPLGGLEAVAAADALGTENRSVALSIEVDSLEYLDPNAPRMQNRFEYAARGWGIWTYMQTMDRGTSIPEGLRLCQIRKGASSAMITGSCPSIDEVAASDDLTKLGEATGDDNPFVGIPMYLLRANIVEHALSDGPVLPELAIPMDRARLESVAAGDLTAFSTQDQAFCEDADDECSTFTTGNEPYAVTHDWVIDQGSGLLLNHELVINQVPVSSWTVTELSVD